MNSSSLWIVVIISAVVNGSLIEFSGVPAVFHPLQEDVVTLRCSLLGLQPVVGRRAADDTKRQTADHVTSIVISLDGKVVATLTDTSRVRVHGDHDVPNLKVTGSLTGQGDQLGYLQLTWTNPHQNQTGGFECEVTGVTNNGPFVKNKPAQVIYTQPAVNEIVESLLGLKFDVSSGSNNVTMIVDHNQGLDVLETNLTTQANEIEFLRSKFSEQEKELLALKDRYNKTESENADLKSQLSTITSQLSDVLTNSSSLAATLNVLLNTSAAADDSLTALHSAAARTNTTLTAMDGRLSHAQNTADAVSAGLQGLANNFTDQQSAVQDLGTQLTNLGLNVTDNSAAQSAMSQSLADTNGKLTGLTSNLTDLSGRYDFLTNVQHDMQGQLGNVTSQLPAVNTELERLKHVESGRINCGDSEQWTGVSLSGSQKYNEVFQAFDKPYTRPPVVHLARQFINDWEDTNFFNFIVVNNVTSAGFVATCGAAAQNDHVKAMWISWISVPH